VERDAAHVPVLLAETIEHLKLRPGQIILDGTAGGGGHAAAVWERIRPGGRLLLLDRDRGALERLMARFGRGGDVRYFQANFCDLDQVLAEAGHPQIDGALLDLGTSSLQLADGERGFSLDRAGPLDMRFDQTQALTAAAIVNRWHADRLASLFRDCGDQPFSRRIARAIVEARRRKPIERTDELADLVTAAIPASWRHQQKIHPATRVFQSLRIATNDEYGSLETFLDKVFRFMKPGGRVVIIAFHSGEDRIVKNRFRDAAREGLVTLPVAGLITPTPDEVAANPRSRSSRLRVAERLRAAG
jgi:16S rRNA (cytosine1402-N4)-methyltransferase